MWNVDIWTKIPYFISDKELPSYLNALATFREENMPYIFLASLVLAVLFLFLYCVPHLSYSLCVISLAAVSHMYSVDNFTMRCFHRSPAVQEIADVAVFGERVHAQIRAVL